MSGGCWVKDIATSSSALPANQQFFGWNSDISAWEQHRIFLEEDEDEWLAAYAAAAELQGEAVE